MYLQVDTCLSDSCHLHFSSIDNTCICLLFVEREYCELGNISRMLVKRKNYNYYFLQRVKIVTYWFMQLMLWQHLSPNSENRQSIANKHHEISLKNTFTGCDFTYSKSKSWLKDWFNLLKVKCYWMGRLTLKWSMSLAGIVPCTAHEKSSVPFPSNQQIKLSSNAGQIPSYTLVAALCHLNNPEEL